MSLIQIFKTFKWSGDAASNTSSYLRHNLYSIEVSLIKKIV